MSPRFSSSTRDAISKIISPIPVRSRPRNSRRSATRFHGSATTVGFFSRSPSRVTSRLRPEQTADTTRAIPSSSDSTTCTSATRSPPEGEKAASRSIESFSNFQGNTSSATAISRFTLSTVCAITGATSSQTASEWEPSSASASKRTRSTSASWRVASFAVCNNVPTRSRSRP